MRGCRGAHEVRGDAVEDVITTEDFLNSLMTVFYRTGMVGLKTDPTAATGWSFRFDSPQADLAMISEDTAVYLCPVFWRVLGVNPKSVDGQSLSGGGGTVH